MLVGREEETSLAAQVAAIGKIVDRAADVEVADSLVAIVPGVVEQGSDCDQACAPGGSTKPERFGPLAYPFTQTARYVST
jgi:hypothetical protein